MIWLVLNKTILKDLEIEQKDIIRAFLKAKIEEKLYLTLPTSITTVYEQLILFSADIHKAKKERLVI